MSRRPGSDFANILKKKQKTDQQTSAAQASHANSNASSRNKYLSTPVQPERALAIFLTQARQAARRFLPKESTTYPVTKPFCEIEARFGILKLPFGQRDRRVTSSGPKLHNGTVVKAFHCHQEPSPAMESGVSRTHFVTWTQGGLVSSSWPGLDFYDFLLFYFICMVFAVVLDFVRSAQSLVFNGNP